MATKVEGYQAKFITLEEATSDAKKQSAKLGTKLSVIQSKTIFYVDTNTVVRDWETLHVIYENGKKVKA
ncbi:hypothetical protein BH09BAC1_BH09BAC1_13150 [soil metagenome]